MILKLLGIFDILTGIIFWLFTVFKISSLSSVILLLGLLLLVKGIIFLTNFNIASILDIISSFIILISNSTTVDIIFVSVVSIYLIQKGIISLVS